MDEHEDCQHSMNGAQLQGQSCIHTLGPVDPEELGRGPVRLQVMQDLKN